MLWDHLCPLAKDVPLTSPSSPSSGPLKKNHPRIPVPVSFTVRFALYWLPRFRRAYTILTAPDVILHSMTYCNPFRGYLYRSGPADVETMLMFHPPRTNTYFHVRRAHQCDLNSREFPYFIACWWPHPWNSSCSAPRRSEMKRRIKTSQPLCCSNPTSTTTLWHSFGVPIGNFIWAVLIPVPIPLRCSDPHIDDYSMTLFWGPGREFCSLSYSSFYLEKHIDVHLLTGNDSTCKSEHADPLKHTQFDVHMCSWATRSTTCFAKCWKHCCYKKFLEQTFFVSCCQQKYS